MKPLVLITRPLKEAESLAVELSALGCDTHIEPLLSIEMLPVTWPDPSGFDGVVATSARGLSAVPENWLSKPLLTVGDHTAEQGRQAGFTDVRSASGNAVELERIIGEQKGLRCLLHPCGMNGQALDAPGVEIVRLPVYRADTADILSGQLLRLLNTGSLAAVLFYSPRTGRVFAELIEKHGCTHSVKSTKALCLSAPVVQSVHHLPWQDVRQADRPDQASMLDLVRRFIVTA